MPIKNISKFAVLSSFFCAAALAGCSGQADAKPAMNTQKAQARQSFQSTPKMGPAVRFSSNYDGRSNSGEIENIRFEIFDNYASGTLTVQLLDSAGLEVISNGREFTFQMGGSEPHILDLQIKPLKDGNLNLNFYTISKIAPGQSIGGAAHAVLYVGDAAGPNAEGLKGTHAVIENEKSATPGIISMPAQEEIK